MKRSQMTKIMTESWLGLWPNEDPEVMGAADIFEEVQYKMGHLLDWMIHKGMMPPPQELSGSNHREWEASAKEYFEVFEWEPEQEPSLEFDVVSAKNIQAIELAAKNEELDLKEKE